jgi:hypothetical protein
MRAGSADRFCSDLITLSDSIRSAIILHAPEANAGDVVRLRLGPYRIWYLFHPDAIEPVLTRQASEFIRLGE